MNEQVSAKPRGFKIFTYDTVRGFNGPREFLSKFATDVKIVKDFWGNDYIIMIVPRGIDDKVDELIREAD